MTEVAAQTGAESGVETLVEEVIEVETACWAVTG